MRSLAVIVLLALCSQVNAKDADSYWQIGSYQPAIQLASYVEYQPVNPLRQQSNPKAGKIPEPTADLPIDPDCYLLACGHVDSRDGAFYSVWSSTRITPRILYFSQSDTYSTGGTSVEIDQYRTEQNARYQFDYLPLDLAFQYEDGSHMEGVGRGGLGVRVHDILPCPDGRWQYTTIGYLADTDGQTLLLEHNYIAWPTDWLRVRGFVDHEIDGNLAIQAGNYLDVWFLDHFFVTCGVLYDSAASGKTTAWQAGIGFDLHLLPR